MGVYETLFRFMDVTGRYMGSPGTRPWAQGYPLTRQLPGGPPLPGSVELGPDDLKYPPAAGIDVLRESIASYYRHFYGASISADNVAVFAGGRPAIYATLAFLLDDIEVVIEETEYTPYYDMLRLLKRNHTILSSGVDNHFCPTLQDYRRATAVGRKLIVKSNPCNPTGVTWVGQELRDLVELCSTASVGAIFDEAYEFYTDPQPVSAISHVADIEQTNIFLIGAATKGLQVPGLRVGWVVAAWPHIEVFRNYSSIGMGGVSRASQLYVAQLLQLPRVEQARRAVGEFFKEQRDRYRDGLQQLGLHLFTGCGGFYHWGRLPNGLSAEEFNRRLFAHQAAILPGTLCDMYRRGPQSPLADFVRFSFGPILPETYDDNLRIIESCLAGSPAPARVN